MIKHPRKQEFLQKQVTEAGLPDFSKAYGQNLNKNSHFGHFY